MIRFGFAPLEQTLVIVQSRYAPFKRFAAKVASGRWEHISVVYETNLARTIVPTESGYFGIALDERGEKQSGRYKKYNKTLLVLGAEGPWLTVGLRDKCDVLVQVTNFWRFIKSECLRYCGCINFMLNHRIAFPNHFVISSLHSYGVFLRVVAGFYQMRLCYLAFMFLS